MSEKKPTVEELQAKRKLELSKKFAIFEVLNQAISIGGTRYYPVREGQTRSQKKKVWPSEFVKLSEWKARAFGVEGEVREGVTCYLKRVTDKSIKPTDKSKLKKRPKKGQVRERNHQ
ncbi:MAG: hypothetical protein KAS32_21220 [Candidatus Peribacteraceae bacterium]|nr:hypothetical protein [Candidatus Peribacteraceae bacterium]